VVDAVVSVAVAVADVVSTSPHSMQSNPFDESTDSAGTTQTVAISWQRGIVTRVVRARLVAVRMGLLLGGNGVWLSFGW
jgi:hypothetical protein